MLLREKGRDMFKMRSLFRLISKNSYLLSIFRKSYILSNLYDLFFRVLPRFKILLEYRRLKDKTPEKIYRLAEKIGFGQNRKEIESVIDILKEFKPKILVEIGTQSGGNGFYLSNFMPEGSKLITIDLAPRISFEMAKTYDRMKARKSKLGRKIRKLGIPFSSGCSIFNKWCLKSFSNKNCQIIPFYTYLNPSEDSQFLSNIVLDGKKFDAIFYDADKTEYGVQSILKAYLPLLKKGGLFIIQDINYSVDSGNNGATLYWKNLDENQFKKLGEYIVNPPGTVSGIGIAIKL